MNQQRLMKVLLSPHTSEKAYLIGDASGTVTFKVALDATKLEIKKAVEQLFEVKVKSVRTVTIKGKTRIFKRIKGKTKTIKKAYVSLQKGHDINFVEA